jgi:hypothetical protein
VRGVVGQRRGDLARGDDHPPRRVEDDLDRLVVRRVGDRTQDALGVVDVDVADDREAEEVQRLLTVDEGDDRRLVLARDDRERAPALGEQDLSGEGWL